MFRSIALILALICSVAPTVLAQSQKTITLKDGTTIQGELTGINEGNYIIQSPALGELSVKEDQVASITSGASPRLAQETPTLTGNASADSINAAQTQIMSNPALMQEIQTLASDPEVIKIMSDPEFQKAAMAKDMNAISQSPRTQELLKNPKIKALLEKIQAAQQQ